MTVQRLAQAAFRRTTISAIAVAAAMTLPAAAHAQDAAKGASLLTDARKAIGGEDKVAAVKRLQANGSFKRAQGNNTLEGDFEIFIEAPDKYRLNEETGVAGGPTTERTQVLNGAEIWDETSGGGFPGGGFRGGRGGDFGGGDRGGFGGRGRGGETGANGGAAPAGAGRQGIDPERVKELQRRQRQADLARYLLAFVLTTDQPVTWIGTAQSPDGTADVLEVAAPQGGTATRVFLDTKTHLPLMLTWEGGGGGRFGGGRGRRGGGDAPAGAAPNAPAAPPQAPTTEMHLAEYKTVNGLKLPTLITRSVNGQTTEEMTVKNYKINPNFKASTFNK